MQVYGNVADFLGYGIKMLGHRLMLVTLHISRICEAALNMQHVHYKEMEESDCNGLPTLPRLSNSLSY